MLFLILNLLWRKVKRGLTGVPSAVPRIHLPTVCSRLLPRRPHLPPTDWAPRGTLNRPQSTSKTLQRLAPTPAWVGAPLIGRHLLGASNTSKRFRETLEQTLAISGQVVGAQWLRFYAWRWNRARRAPLASCNLLRATLRAEKTKRTSTPPIRSEIHAENA